MDSYRAETLPDHGMILGAVDTVMCTMQRAYNGDDTKLTGSTTA